MKKIDEKELGRTITMLYDAMKTTCISLALAGHLSTGQRDLLIATWKAWQVVLKELGLATSGPEFRGDGEWDCETIQYGDKLKDNMYTVQR